MIKKHYKKLLLCAFVVLIILCLVYVAVIGGNPLDIFERGFQTQLEQMSMSHHLSYDNGRFTSTGNDPQMYFDTSGSPAYRFVHIDVKSIPPGHASEIFYAESGFPDGRLVTRMWLKEGMNRIAIDYGAWGTLRIDPVASENVTFEINSISISNIVTVTDIMNFLLISFVLVFIWCSAFYLWFYRRAFVDKAMAQINKALFGQNDSHEDVSVFSLRQSRCYWVCVAITVLLCYGFTLTNHSIGLDSELLVFNDYPEQDFLTQGRWGHYLLSFLPISFLQFVPFWNSFITLILRVVAATFWVNLFKKHSNGFFNNTAGIIFTCVSISLPYLATGFYIMHSNIQGGISRILLVICAYLMFDIKSDSLKLKLSGLSRFLICTLILTFCLSLAESALPMYLIGFYSLLFLNLIVSTNNNVIQIKALLFKTLIVILTCGLSIVLSGIIGDFLQSITGSGSYDHTLSYMRYDLSSFSSFINSVMHSLTDLIAVIFRFNDVYSNNLVVASRLIILISTLFITLLQKRIAILLVGVFLLLSSISLEIVSGNYTDYSARTLAYTANFVGIAFSIIYVLVSKIRIRKFTLKPILAVIIAAIILNSSLWMNRIFYEHYLHYQYRLDVMRTISRDLSEFEQSKPVGFIGELLVKKIPDYRIFAEIHMNYSSLYPTMRANLSIHAFFASHGYELYGFVDNLVNFQANPSYGFLSTLDLDQFSSIPAFPQDGYILETDNYIIVKLGPLS